ncbi:MAG: SRPBCC family protein, partial [Haloferacaceae archaeon]
RYSEYLEGVDRDGDGGAGTRYRLHFAWWKLSYTARSEVTGVERPERIDWRIVGEFDAEGRWRVEPAELPPDAPADAGTASRVFFEAGFDAGSLTGDTVDLPRFVSLDGVIDRVRPLVLEEAERIVERVVADLEGRRREVDLRVEREG